MVTERLEVRLDPERRRKLAELAAARHAALSQTMREIIDQAYEDAKRELRVRAARELAAMEVEDVPDPETLSRQLAEAHDPGIP